MSANETGLPPSLDDSLSYLGLTAGLNLNLNQTLLMPRSRLTWPFFFNVFPLTLGFIGLLFNVLALLIFSVSKTFRHSSFRCYIYAFVLVNCVSIITHSWLYLLFYIVDPIHVCKYSRYLQQASSTTSLWIMVLLSFERSFTFTRPFTVKKLLKSRTICIIISLFTCLCFFLHIDELINVEVKAYRWVNFAYGLCSIKRNSRFFFSTDRFKILTHSFSFILPFVLNSILDVYICWKICQRRKRLISSSNSSTSSIAHSIRRRSKKSLANEITVTLLCQSMWLLFTYFPTRLYYLLISFKIINDHERDNSTLIVLMRQNLLVYLAFSPTLYVILSPTLRKEIALHIHRTYKRKKATSSTLWSSNKKLPKIVIDAQNGERRLTILITRSEQLPRRVLFTPAPVVIQKSYRYTSKSAPCLLHTTIDDDIHQFSKKRGRSNTLQML